MLKIRNDSARSIISIVRRLSALFSRFRETDGSACQRRTLSPSRWITQSPLTVMDFFCYNKAIMESLKPGNVLKDRYRIEKVLGEGAHGTVYCAADLTIEGTFWAIKEIRESAFQPGERQEVLSHFYREAEILKSLNHTGIPKVIDAFSLNSCHYMLMEHVEGRTLQELMRIGQPDVQSVVGWALRLCQILTVIHESKPHPLIFRDIKPSNIMLTKRGRLLLIDFGIARYLNPEKNGDTVALGTPGYAPPEQYGNASTDCRSDIYSLGATMYELLTGADLASFQFCFPPVAELNSSVGPALEGIIMRCLERLPEKRFQNAVDLRDALIQVHRKKRVKAGGPSGSAQPGPMTSSPGSSLQKPVPLAPLPPAARLWNPPTGRPPLGARFMPAKMLKIVENLAEPASIVSRNLFLPFLFSVLMIPLSMYYGFSCGAFVFLAVIIQLVIFPRLFPGKHWAGFLIAVLFFCNFMNVPLLDLIRWWLSMLSAGLNLVVALLLLPLLILNRYYSNAAWVIFLAIMDYSLMLIIEKSIH
ncbi:MAG: serine/threonine protein kinase [Candidatus Xenobiia bacterium LiM19]